MKRKQRVIELRALTQIIGDHPSSYQWIKPNQFATANIELELVILKKDGYYIPIKF